MSTVKPTDKVLVNRAGIDHSTPVAMSTVQDTDLLLVNRAGVDYKCTYKDWKASQSKAPAIGGVTLADSPEAGRFTSGTFATTVTGYDAGSPAATVGMKAWVEGALKSKPLSDAITSIVADPAVVTYEQRFVPGITHYSKPDVGSLPFSAWVPQTMGSVTPPSGSDPNFQVTQVKLPFPASVVFGVLVPGYTSGQTGYDIWANWSDDGVTYAPWQVVSSNLIPGSGTIAAYKPPAVAKYWTFYFSKTGDIASSDGAMNAYGILGEKSLSTFHFASGKDLSNFAADDALKEVGNGSDATAACLSVDTTANTMKVYNITGTWDVDSKVEGPFKTVMGRELIGTIQSSATGSVKASDYLKSHNTVGGPDLGWKPGNPASNGFNGDPSVSSIFAWGNGAGTNDDYNCTWKPPTPVIINPGGELMYAAWQNGKGEAGGSLTQCFYVYAPNGTRITTGFTASDVDQPWNTTSTVSAVKLVNTSGAPITVGSFEFHRYGSVTVNRLNPVVLTGLMVNGVWLNDSAPLMSLTLDAIKTGSVEVGDVIHGSTSSATGTVSVIDATSNTISVTPNAGTFQDGEKVLGKEGPASNVKLYTVHDAAGAVSDLQSADPGYVTMTGNSPYTLTFPATLPSGNPPDTDLPAGTTITTEVQATNTAGTVTKTSNTVTPA